MPTDLLRAPRVLDPALSTCVVQRYHLIYNYYGCSCLFRHLFVF